MYEDEKTPTSSELAPRDTLPPAPGVGEHVLFTLDKGPRKGEARPAVVVRVLDPLMMRVVLVVFVDADGRDGMAYSFCPTHVEACWSRRPHEGAWHR